MPGVTNYPHRKAVSVAACLLSGQEGISIQRWVVSAYLKPLPCREIAKGKDTQDSHNAQHGCSHKRIVKPLE